MPRVAEPRAPAEPTTPGQHARRGRILKVAGELGAAKGLDRVQMQEVARRADVALSTLYRYFPSKTHLFVGVMAAQVDRMADRFARRGWARAAPEEAVFEVIQSASRALLQRPRLATAAMQSLNAADPTVVTDVHEINERMTRLLLDAAGVDDPDTDDLTRMRLILQAWYGVLQSGLNGRISLEEAESDMRVATRLLLAPLPDGDAGRAPAGPDGPSPA